MTTADHRTRISVYRHARRTARGVIAECDTCGWSGPMRVLAMRRMAIADANEHVRQHRPKRRRR